MIFDKELTKEEMLALSPEEFREYHLYMKPIREAKRKADAQEALIHKTADRTREIAKLEEAIRNPKPARLCRGLGPAHCVAVTRGFIIGEGGLCSMCRDNLRQNLLASGLPF